MEDKILEVMKNCKRLPDYVFSRKYHYIYFFEMPMAQIVFQSLIKILATVSASNNYSGILLEPFNHNRSPYFRFSNEIPETPKVLGDEEKEVIWAYNIGYIKGANWEIYYEFNSELLLVGIEANKDDFEESIRAKKTVMDYHYSFSELLNYFKLVATSNDRIPLDIECADYLNKLKLNYSQYASSIKE